MRRNILYVYRNLSTIEKKDLLLLTKHYKVNPLHASLDIIIYPMKLFLLMQRCDLVFTRFAGWHAFIAFLFAKLFGKKRIVVAGGYDTVADKKLNYGAYVSWWRGVMSTWIFRNANVILPVDPSLKGQIIRNADANGRKIHWVPNGFDAEFWNIGGEKEDFFLTVCSEAEENYLIKGLDRFFCLARLLPEKSFIVVGPGETLNPRIKIPRNVQVVGHKTSEALRDYFRRAKYYCQFSRHEGLPNALCEAMLCGCYPIGTRVNGIVTAIGDVGLLVDDIDVGLVDKIRGMKIFHPIKYRRQILENFPMERREQELRFYIDKLIGD